jgi:hypothetical protein
LHRAVPVDCGRWLEANRLVERRWSRRPLLKGCPAPVTRAGRPEENLAPAR